MRRRRWAGVCDLRLLQYKCIVSITPTRVGAYYLRHLLSVRVEKGVWHAVQDAFNSLVLWVNYRHRFIFAVHHLWVG